jgi:murein DD-endopeptidase MepM/ murein hydrolase activator NlpD
VTRVGWIFLGVVLLCAAAFASMTRFGGTPASGEARTAGSHVVIRLEDAARSAMARWHGLPVLTVPVRGVARSAVIDTWGQARSEGRAHHGTDIPAAAGTPVLAAADGVVEKLFDSRLGGTTIYQRSPDRRWTFYYAHLAGYSPGLHEGQVVRAGQPIGFVGDTGDAGVGNYHLHFGLTQTDPAQHWYEGEDVNAYPLLARGGPGR